ncbi:MAG: hypothetical protein DYG89_40490 [Caldilinea sp. CFX5]|nr:hypothetical protein [Caldilinea sp. CFX5]
MAYSDFTIPQLKEKFHLTIEEETKLFDTVTSVELPLTLADILRRYLPLAVNLNTEKARSELIIAPFLAEFKLLYREQISLFSGIDFNIDETAGLKGRCDYILAQSPEQLVLTAPVCMLVEAKNENIIAGIPQCLAEMVAAQRFNAASGTLHKSAIYGVVTTGSLWRFLRLQGTIAQVDQVEYAIQEPGKIFAILQRIAITEL